MQSTTQRPPLPGSGTLRPIGERRRHLQTLLRAITKHEVALHAGLQMDLGKSRMEAFTTETGFVQRDIRHALRHLERWSRPRRVRPPPALLPARARVVPEPKGVVLILGPWNYPVQLLLSPLVAAWAAGNSVVLKPSEHAPHTSAALRCMLHETFLPESVQVVEGGRETVARLMQHPFDHVFFTGGLEAGRSVACEAARHMIPVTLELGGKCPVLVAPDADPACTARRIVRGKFMNAGQTCVAPDHVWVPRAQLDLYVRLFRDTIRQHYGHDPQQSPDYGRIINVQHIARLQALYPSCMCDAPRRYIAPTVIANPPLDTPLMREEIFGPLLPVIPYDHEDAFIAWCQTRPVPLALYLFTREAALQERMIQAIRSGGVCVNDTVMHILPHALPFGGRGESGMGAYHGKTGFDTFSHFRSILKRSNRFDLRGAYPPFRVPLRLVKGFYRLMMGR